jgi:flagellar hook-associated protein 1 FlgK
MLERLSGIADVSASFGTDGSVSVRAGGSGGPLLVSGGNVSTLGMAIAADGTLAFDVGGWRGCARRRIARRPRARAARGGQCPRPARHAGRGIATLVNDSQASGVALDGSAGQPLFTGTTAATLRAAFTSGSLIVTAPAGSPAGSRDATTLSALGKAFETGGVADQMNVILFDVSSRVAGHKITTEALDTIAASARISLEQQSRRRPRHRGRQPDPLPAGVPGLGPGDAGRERHLRFAAQDWMTR